MPGLHLATYIKSVIEVSKAHSNIKAAGGKTCHANCRESTMYSNRVKETEQIHPIIGNNFSSVFCRPASSPCSVPASKSRRSCFFLCVLLETASTFSETAKAFSTAGKTS